MQFIRRGNLLRKALMPPAIPTKRNFAQVGLVVSTPPRNPCSGGEKIAHALFLVSVWLGPVFYFMTQLKVWRRRYLA